MNILENIDGAEWHGPFASNISQQAIQALEAGRVLFLPQLNFVLSEKEKQFLSPGYADQKSKNISFDLHKAKMRGAVCASYDYLPLQKMMERYALQARALITALLPKYTSALEMARTSFRPVEVSGRNLSYRKDDTRLHVDAFPSSPNQGRRILRVFTNVNPENKDRVWRIGESFETVSEKFFSKLSAPLPGSAYGLKLFKLTRSWRTRYDHYMLQLHNRMKGDLQYQKTAEQQTVLFPPNSTWVVYTDRVSHAAMSGQHLFEQTFHLPVSAMHDEMLSPLRILEKHAGRGLI